MKKNEVIALAKSLNGSLQETHISWVILADKFAYKIKKPLKFSFLDFSTLERRKHFCEEEFKLNSRLSGVYLGLVYLEKNERGHVVCKEHTKSACEVAVKMKRLPDKDRMDRRVARKQVQQKDMQLLAYQIALFHKGAIAIDRFDDNEFIERRFKDVLQVKEWIEKNIGQAFAEVLIRSVAYHNHFLASHGAIFVDRVKRGFKRDVHGDLHTQNIFLTAEPVVFDCIEFNSLYREIDVLNEVAFLCMDLEVLDRSDLSAAFLMTYLDLFSCIESHQDEALFHYYKCYRANVKIKVLGLRAMQDGESNTGEYSDLIKKYVSLLDRLLKKVGS